MLSGRHANLAGIRAGLADVILKLAGEVRQQLGLQLAISRTLVDLKVVKDFQELIVEVIWEESPTPRGGLLPGSKSGARFGRAPSCRL